MNGPGMKICRYSNHEINAVNLSSLIHIVLMVIIPNNSGTTQDLGSFFHAPISSAVQKDGKLDANDCLKREQENWSCNR